MKRTPNEPSKNFQGTKRRNHYDVEGLCAASLRMNEHRMLTANIHDVSNARVIRLLTYTTGRENLRDRVPNKLRADLSSSESLCLKQEFKTFKGYTVRVARYYESMSIVLQYRMLSLRIWRVKNFSNPLLKATQQPRALHPNR